MISQKQILIVEDNEINRMLLGEILSADYQVVEAENGLEALSVLKERGDVISLILLDITMPVMDGYTFLSIVKKDPVFSSIPVIVTTQSDSESVLRILLLNPTSPKSSCTEWQASLICVKMQPWSTS